MVAAKLLDLEHDPAEDPPLSAPGEYRTGN